MAESSTKQMPPLLVPDDLGVSPQPYPQDARFKLQPATLNLMDVQLVTVVVGFWKAYGSGDIKELPKAEDIPQVSLNMGDLRSDAMSSYQLLAFNLQSAFETMLDAHNKVFDKVTKTIEDRQASQNKVADWIEKLNVKAAEPPDDGQNENEYIMTYVADGLKSGETIMNDAKGKQKDNGDGVETEADKLKKLTEQVKTLTEQNKSLQQQLAAAKGNGGGGGGGGDTTYDPNLLGQQGSGDGSYTPMDFGLDGTGTDQTGTGTGGSLTDGLSSGSNSASDPSGLGTGSTSGTSPISATPASMTSPDSGMSSLGSGMGSGMGGMGDMMSQMLPMLAQMQMMRQMQDQGLNGRNGGLQPTYPQQPVVSAQPAAATPQQTQPAASPASATAQSDAAPKGASSSQSQQAGAVPPGRTPGADGTVEYPFPDGRTQKVSLVVAQALDAAFGNHGGTDAQKAYEKTTAKWTDNKQIGDHIDPNQLMTGDVGVWEKTTAVLVVFGSGTDGTIEAIIDGELQKLDSDKMDSMSGKAGEFGTFTEFQHPRGIEATAPDHQADSAPGMPMPGDQQGGVLSAAVGTPT
ncbi:hypothetical protein [Nocardia cerradoensis]|uniref:Uncharacterized protein n=1 Tax=Nocardia cerradoensis TaxID=85688 RepID=A0A231GX26_9NOCA|nr:hypothetical protein [Nocardia cerradoensis]NKY44831.1 hypothetical protein [Nocardia cerradoensis]OXR41183.1 hypothetical protein B7C42_06779 [Nocardia cerradoensis]